jgi:hypothetical protein
MEKHYQIFRLKTEEHLERDGYNTKTVDISKLEHYGYCWIDTKKEAVEELPNDGCKYVILEVYS